MDIGDKPDILALESVRCDNANGWIIACAIRAAVIAIPLALIGDLLYYLLFTESFPHPPQLAAVIMATLLVLALVYPRHLRPNLSWQTDGVGLTESGLLHRRRIEWTAIDEAKTLRKLGRGHFCSIRSGRTRISIPISPVSLGPQANGLVLGSIWQQLRRAGRVEDIELPMDLQTLWWTIPQSIPREIDWENPRPAGRGRMLLGSAVALVATIAWIWFGTHMDVFIWVLPCALILATALVLRPSKATPKSFRLRDDGFETETIGGSRLSGSWVDITRVLWALDSLQLCFSRPGECVCIPYIADGGSPELVLGVIRRLRETDHPQLVTIPEHLWPACGVKRPASSVVV